MIIKSKYCWSGYYRIGAMLLFISMLWACNDNKVLFSSLPASQTHINFINKPASAKGLSILYYLYYYNGGGVSIGDINNDSLPDIYFTANNKGGNKLYLNKGNFEFEDITDKAGVAGLSDWCTGSTMADVNGDGKLDIYISTVSQRYGLTGHNELYINNGNLSFTESSAKYGLNTSCATTQSAFFDYDRDGDLDCYILNQSHHPHANIVDTSYRRKYDTLSGDRLYRNDIATSGKFTEVSREAGIFQSNLGYGLGIAIADLNNDGWDDIYIGNDFHENDYYYINNKNGSFSESGAKHFGHYSRFSMGNDIADYNNDGQLDIITVDMLPPEEKIVKTYGSDENPDIYKVKLEIQGYQKQYSKNCLQRNNGDGLSFSEVALISGVSATDWSWCPLFADFDNDGKKDLFISSGIVKRPVDLDYIKYVSDMQMKKGINQTDKYDEEVIAAMPEGNSHPYFFKGDGKLSFKDMSDAWGTDKLKGCFNGAAYADLNNDGALDLVINSFDAPAIILKNNSAKGNYLSVSFKGNKGNSFGLGTKVYLFQPGGLQYQQMMTTRGFQSSSDTKLHFGLDSSAIVDSILIVWPNQKKQVIARPPTNRTLVVDIANALDSFDYREYFKPQSSLFETADYSKQIGFKHHENDFFDYNVQYLIPHLQSTRGPKTAVADINRDGLSDMYICGGSGQPGALMIQENSGTFKRVNLQVKDRIALTEEVDAHFFDANNDGYPDLYIASGGAVFEDGNPGLKDNFYLNDGKGNLVQVPTAIPSIPRNKSCVTSSDIDKDGDLDLFVGGLVNSRIYGLPQSSYLLLNDGKANFTKADSKQINLDTIGIVTTASFADVNKDSWPDLVVSGEWMPIKIFINKNGRFESTEIASSTGLWQSLYTTDINADGATDLLLGNWGKNTKLWAGKSGPLKLYVKDFDKNGSIEQVMCYNIDGQEYTFLAKDELERALPVLKKAYLKYSEVAGKTVQYMFYDLFKDFREYKAEHLASACFLNDGKGGFTKIDLPDELQLSPLFSFSAIPGTNQWIGGGNFYGVIPYEGRYDAQKPISFSFNKDSKKFVVNETIELSGELRDIDWLDLSSGKKQMILTRNNEEPVLVGLKAQNH